MNRAKDQQTVNIVPQPKRMIFTKHLGYLDYKSIKWGNSLICIAFYESLMLKDNYSLKIFNNAVALVRIGNTLKSKTLLRHY